MNDSGLSDATVFVSLALFSVWMYRQKVKTLSGSPTRWGAFFGALSGKYTIASNLPDTTSSSSTSSSSSSTSTSSSSSVPLTNGSGFNVGPNGSINVP